MSDQAVGERKEAAEPAERNWFLPHGRIGRVAYGVRWLIVLGAYCLVAYVERSTTGGQPNGVTKALYWIPFLFLVITSIKRLHDIGYGALAVIFLGPIVPLLLFAPGQRGTNAYGVPPSPPFGRRKASEREAEVK